MGRVRTLKSKILLLVLIVLLTATVFFIPFPSGSLKARFTSANKKLLKMTFT